MAQFARPVADEAAGSWTATPLWSKVDEGVATPDGTTVQSEAVGNNTATSFADFQLGSVTDPQSSTGHIIRVLWRHNQNNRSLEGHAELWQGAPGTGTQIASLDVTPDVGTTPATDSYTLSAGESDGVTNYGNLYMRLWGFGSSGGPSRSLIVDAVELEIPDAAAVIPSGTGALAGGGVLAGIGEALFSGTGALQGGGALTGVGEALFSGTGALRGGGTLQGTGQAPSTLAEGTGALSGGGTLQGIGEAVFSGSGALSGGGALQGIGSAPALAPEGTGAIAGGGALAGVGEVAFSGVGAIQGGGTLIGIGGGVQVGEKIKVSKPAVALTVGLGGD